MNFLLQKGDIFRLLKRENTLSAGYYKITDIGPSWVAHPNDELKPSRQVYRFQRIKIKDGTNYGQSNGYTALIFDEEFLRTGKAIKVIDKPMVTFLKIQN